jgi:putative colanic acid biosynthesis UDP-glucose lipid carrier transferase
MHAKGTLHRLAPLMDAAALAVAAYAAWVMRFSRAEPPPAYTAAVVIALLLAILVLPAAGAYKTRHWRHPLRGVAAAMPGLGLVFGALLLLAALTKTTADFSRLWMGVWTLLSPVLLCLWRFTLWRKASPNARHALLLGSGRLAEQIGEALAADQGPVVSIGCISLPGEETAVEDNGPRIAQDVLGTLEELDHILARTKPAIDELWLVPDRRPGEEDEALLTQLRLYSLPVRYVPNLSTLRLLGHRASEVAGITVIDLNATPLDGPEAIAKLVMDRALSALLLLILSPCLLLIGALIRLDSPGPALFRQPRHGSGGRIIEVLKFRTMRHDPQADDAEQARRDDPRVTRLGSFLRRSSLDELPQLINVLRGDMSLVGPRPHPIALNEAFAQRLQDYMQRHRVLPGITGWAQVNGFRGETDTLEKMAGRLEHDLYYIEHWSLGLDLYILARTAVLGWGGRNAY